MVVGGSVVVGVAVLTVPAAAVTAPLVCGVIVVDRGLAVVVAEGPASVEMGSVYLTEERRSQNQA